MGSHTTSFVGSCFLSLVLLNFSGGKNILPVIHLQQLSIPACTRDPSCKHLLKGSLSAGHGDTGLYASTQERLRVKTSKAYGETLSPNNKSQLKCLPSVYCLSPLNFAGSHDSHLSAKSIPLSS